MLVNSMLMLGTHKALGAIAGNVEREDAWNPDKFSNVSQAAARHARMSSGEGAPAAAPARFDRSRPPAAAAPWMMMMPPPVQPPWMPPPPLHAPWMQPPPLQAPWMQQPPLQAPWMQQPPVQAPWMQQPPVQAPWMQQPPVQAPWMQQPPLRAPWMPPPPPPPAPPGSRPPPPFFPPEYSWALLADKNAALASEGELMTEYLTPGKVLTQNMIGSAELMGLNMAQNVGGAPPAGEGVAALDFVAPVPAVSVARDTSRAMRGDTLQWASADDPGLYSQDFMSLGAVPSVPLGDWTDPTTGAVYTAYESALPPPDADYYEMARASGKHTKLGHLQGGFAATDPYPERRELLQDDFGMHTDLSIRELGGGAELFQQSLARAASNAERNSRFTRNDEVPCESTNLDQLPANRDGLYGEKVRVLPRLPNTARGHAMDNTMRGGAAYLQGQDQRMAQTWTHFPQELGAVSWVAPAALGEAGGPGGYRPASEDVHISSSVRGLTAACEADGAGIDAGGYALAYRPTSEDVHQSSSARGLTAACEADGAGVDAGGYALAYRPTSEDVHQSSSARGLTASCEADGSGIDATALGYAPPAYRPTAEDVRFSTTTERGTAVNGSGAYAAGMSGAMDAAAAPQVRPTGFEPPRHAAKADAAMRVLPLGTYAANNSSELAQPPAYRTAHEDVHVLSTRNTGVLDHTAAPRDDVGAGAAYRPEPGDVHTTAGVRNTAVLAHVAAVGGAGAALGEAAGAYRTAPRDVNIQSTRNLSALGAGVAGGVGAGGAAPSGGVRGKGVQSFARASRHELMKRIAAAANGTAGTGAPGQAARAQVTQLNDKRGVFSSRMAPAGPNGFSSGNMEGALPGQLRHKNTHRPTLPFTGTASALPVALDAERIATEVQHTAKDLDAAERRAYAPSLPPASGGGAAAEAWLRTEQRQAQQKEVVF